MIEEFRGQNNDPYISCCMVDFQVFRLGQGRSHVCFGSMVLPTEVGLLSACQRILKDLKEV